ncbi:MAG: hypothetical protein MUD09_08380 [Desulfobacterales bacterium]|nr:hypothetical protein [Desulfobacterales bacterium]
MTTINDLVLIYVEDKPMAFARVEDIQPDMKRGWFQIKFLLLQIPPTIVTWILRDVYINGVEYTMGGQKMRIEKVVVPEAVRQATDASSKESESGKLSQTKAKDPKSKVISLADLKKGTRS